MELRSRHDNRSHQRRSRTGRRYQLRDGQYRLLWSERPLELRHVDQLLFLRSMLDTARRFRLGPVPIRPMALDTRRRVDVALKRTVGLGSLSLRPMVIPVGTRMGLDTGLRL